MRRSLFVVSVAMLSAAGCQSRDSEAPAPAPQATAAPTEVGTVVRADPAFDALVAPDAAIEKVAGGFQFTEGPLWRPDGTLWFSDVQGNVVRSVTPDGQVKVLIENAAGVSTAPPGSYIGPNGMVEDEDGSVLMVQHFNRQIVRVGPDLKMTPLVDKFEGKRFNSPNDLAFGPDGSLYFTDPPYGLPKQNDDPAKEIPFNGVFRVANGRVQAVIRDLAWPNGLAFSPDGKTLYVANSDAANNVLMAYAVAADGSVSGGRVFANMTSQEPGLADGLKVDSKGNVYTTGPAGVWVFSPDGRHLGTIKPPEVPANCGWGDDGKTLYMTANTSIYRIRTLVGK
jgi:gluconolactonase